MFPDEPSYDPEVQQYLDQEQDIREQGYTNSPEARIAFAERAFKGSSSRSDRRAAFNDAFRAARQAGMQEFMFNGMKYAVKLAEAATEHAQKLQTVVDKSQAHQTGLTKGEYDTRQVAGQFTQHALDNIAAMNQKPDASMLRMFPGY